MSFKVASRFFKAAKVINGMSVEKFPLLLNRIIQKLHIKNANFFSSEEEEQLVESFGLSSNEKLRLVLDCCSYIFEQAAFTSTGPEPLFDILLEAEFDEAHAKVFGRLWATQAADYIAKLKAQSASIGYPYRLRSSDYHLNMVVGQSALTKQQEPTALFEFTIDGDSNSSGSANTSSSKASSDTHNIARDNSSTMSAATPAGAATGGVQAQVPVQIPTAERLCVEFSHEELFAFFTQLERVQQQLDSLGAVNS
mmetsp:Transcript_10262/g.16821  ORF Transcript_10262/g.16821 Transcript_10262/m.16821 type:complete len:253 (-) Transcript_10262:130-888(-)